MKKLLAFIVAIGILAVAGGVYAASTMTPAEIAAKLTGKSLETVQSERAAGKTYGTIAKEAGKLDEFQSQVLDQKKQYLDQEVKAGRMTQAQADEIFNSIKSNQASCDGSGNGQCGLGGNGQCGMMNGNGKGAQCGNGGMGMGSGRCGMNQ